MTETRTSTGFDIRDHMPGPAGFLGAGANVIMQLGRPGVGYGVVESTVDSGNVTIHPWKRLRTTITYLVVALFGTEEDRRIYRDAVNRSHVPVKSGPHSPVKYNAFDPQLQLWVAACLYMGVRDMRRWFLGPMDEATEEDLYQYSSRLGTSLQVSQDMWPADRTAFMEYWSDGLTKIRYDDAVRDHLLFITDLKMIPRWLRIGNAQVNRFFTIGSLPPEFRTALRVDWTEKDQRRFDRWVSFLRFVTRFIPRWARMLPLNLQLWEFRLRVKRGWKLT